MYSSYSSPNLRRRAGRSRTGAGLPNDFPCYKAIQEHGELIAKALRLAKSYGDVAIVTLSDRPWVFESADQYVPGRESILEGHGVYVQRIWEGQLDVA